MNFVGNYKYQGNYYSNIYNLDWKNHPNFSWSNNNQGNRLSKLQHFSPLGFEQPTQEKKTSLYDKFDAMMDMMKGLEVHIDSQFETMGNKLDAKVDKLEATH